MDDLCIVTEHPLLIEYVDSLQRKNAEALSFYPRCVFEREAEKHRIFLGLLNGEPCGYLHVGAPGGDVKCHQVCTQYDVRRHLYGSALVAAMEDYANQYHSDSIILRCAFDLEANEFWDSMGYTCVRVVPGGVCRMRKINVWRKLLQPDLFGLVAVEPPKGKTDATIWRKHKRTGIISQFHRGRHLDEYREMILDSQTGCL